MANESTGIRIQIVTTVNSKGADEAKKKIADVGKAATSAGKEGAKGLNEFQKPLANLKQAFGQLTSGFGVGGGFGGQAFNVLKGGLADVKKEAASLNSAWDISGAKIAAFGAIGVGAAVGLTLVAKKAADAFAGWASEVKSVQVRTGASAEDASRLTVVMEHLGVDVGDAARAFQIFGRNVVQGTPALRQYFTGTQFAQLQSKNLIDTLPILQAKYQSLTSANDKSAFAAAAFGRGNAALRPLLSLSADEMERLRKESDALGLTLTQEGINKSTEYKRTLNDLKLAFRGVAVNAGQELIPELTALARTGVTLIEKYNSVDKEFKDLANSGGVLGFVLKSMDFAHVTDGTKSAASAAQQGIDKNEENIQSIEDLQSATLSLFNANRSYERAVNGVADAQDSLASAQRNLSKLQREGAVDEKAVAAAHKQVEQAARGVEQAERGIYDADRSLIEAHRGVAQAERSLMAAQEQREDAVRSLTDAQEGLAEAQRKFEEIKQGPDAFTQAEANLRAAQAATSVQRAQQRLSQAEANADKVRKDYNATAEDKADADLSVVEASQALTAAQLDQQRVQDDLTKTLAEGTEGSDSYKEALDAVQNATRAVEQAQRQQRDSSQAVSDAQEALIDSAGRVEQAEYGHQQALLSLRDAQDAVIEAGQKLREAEAGDPDFAYRLADARNAVAKAQRAVNDANLDAGAAALAAAEAQQKQAEALGAAGANAGQLVAKLVQLRQQNPQFSAFFDQLIKLLGAAYAGIPGSPYAGPPVPGRVPGFADGGTVPGAIGAPTLAVVHGGERIIPAGTNNNVTYVTNVYVGGSVVAERDLAETVRRVQIDQARRGG